MEGFSDRRYVFMNAYQYYKRGSCFKLNTNNTDFSVRSCTKICKNIDIFNVQNILYQNIKDKRYIILYILNIWFHYTIFSYICDGVESGGLAAIIADKILRGTPAGAISVVTPEAHLKINYKAVQELGLTVPESLLSRADEIIR